MKYELRIMNRRDTKHRMWSIKSFFVGGIFLVILFSFLSPVLVTAQAVTGTDGGIGSADPQNTGFQIVPCNEVNPDGTKGTACNFKALIATFNRILKFLLYLSIPLVVGIILYTGFQFLTAGGDAAKLEKAKKMLIPVVIGIFWVLASWLVVNTILKTFLSQKTKDALNQNSEFQKLIK